MENCKAYNVPEKRFSQKLPETGVSNYYARKIQIKVSLIAVPWILLISKILYQNIRKLVRKYRSSRPEVFCKKGVLRSFARFTGNSKAPLVPASKNQYNKCRAVLQPGTYFTRSFIFQVFFYRLGKPIFRNTEKVCYSFFYCNVSSKKLLSLLKMLHKYSIVQNFKEPIKATETAADIVL